MDRENELLLEVIKYLVEMGAINQGGGGGWDGRKDGETTAVAAEGSLTAEVDDEEDEEVQDVDDNADNEAVEG